MQQTTQSQPLWAVHVGCIDDRGIQPVRAWAMGKFGVSLVDSVTQGGMDGFLCAPLPENEEERKERDIGLQRIKRDLFISLEHHHSKPVIVSGHYGCAGNPVSDEDHRQCIKEACGLVRSWGVPQDVAVIGVFVNNDWRVEEVCRA